MYDTATKAQFIDLRAKGWSYEKIARHTGIAPSTLLRWGREYADDIADLKSDYLAASSFSHQRSDFDSVSPEGPAQESYFHNLEGYPDEGRDATPLASVPRQPRRNQMKAGKSRRSRAKADRASGLKKKVRKFLRSPLVRAALRYALFKR